MKRTCALLAVTLLVVAIIVGQQRWSSDDAPASPASRSTSGLGGELSTEGLRQAEQLLNALADLRADTAAYADRHKLVVTIRDEVPLEVWKLDGERCTMVDRSLPTTVEVGGSESAWPIAAQGVPVEAKLLKGGACEATMTIAVDDAPRYDVRLMLKGRDLPKPTRLVHDGKSQSVTLVQ